MSTNHSGALVRGLPAGAAAVLVLLLTACQGDGTAARRPLALEGTPTDECNPAIVHGHDMAAGQAAPFLPSVREYGSLAVWITAAGGLGIDLKGREARFVDNTRNAATPDVQAVSICQEAGAAVSEPRRVP